MQEHCFHFRPKKHIPGMHDVISEAQRARKDELKESLHAYFEHQLPKKSRAKDYAEYQDHETKITVLEAEEGLDLILETKDTRLVEDLPREFPELEQHLEQ